MNPYGNPLNRQTPIPDGAGDRGTKRDNSATNAEHDLLALARKNRPNSDEAQRHLDELRPALEAHRKHSMPNASSIVWPSGLNRLVVTDLSLRARTRNCLNQNRFFERTGPLTVRSLMVMENFGRTSLRDLLGELERYLKACIHDGIVAPHPCATTTNDATSIEPSEPEHAIFVHSEIGDWNRTAEVLRPLLAAAAELNDLETVADVLSTELSELAAILKITPELKAIKIGNLAIGSRGPVSVALERLEDALFSMQPAQRTVVEHRLLRDPQPTLAEVGTLLGVTRERIRQHQVKAQTRITNALGSKLQLVASVLSDKLDPIMAERSFHRRIHVTLGSGDSTAHRLFRQALIAEMGYTRKQGAFMNGQARSLASQIRSHARELRRRCRTRR